MTAFTEKVLGIDFGTQNTRVAALAQHQRMPDIVRNNFSLESTPSVVAFDEVRRYVGEEGFSKITSRPKWAANLMRLLFQGEGVDVQLGYSLEGGVLKTPKGEFNPDQLLAMLFNVVIGYSRTAEKADPKALPAKIVVSVPKCTPQARKNVTTALRIIGMAEDAVEVVTDGSAAAACYHGLRFDTLAKELAEAEPVAVVDIGHGYTTVSVMKIAKTGVAVMGEASRPVGSSAIDKKLLAKLLQDVKETHKEDFTDQPKPFARLRREAQKAKEVMSTVSKYNMNVEALTDTFDLAYTTETTSVDAWAEALTTALSEATNEALEQAGVSLDAVTEVETIGGGWRTPCIQQHLKTLFGKDVLAVHLDPAQTVAQGCALLGVRREPVDEAERPEEVNGLHFFGFSGTEVPKTDAVTEEELSEMQKAEAIVAEEETLYNQRMEARNDLESYVLQLPTIGYQAQLPESTMDTLNEKVRTCDDWINSEEGDAATAEDFRAKLAEMKTEIETNFKSIGEHIEKVRKEEEEKDRKREQEAKEAAQTKEPKTDPQRIKAAQERKDQGVVLFKAGEYAECITRFVQALAHLKDIYDLEKDEIKQKRNELALSCHLNIASSSIKLKKWAHAAKNCTQALDYDANSAKALFRRGQANRHLADFEVARADLKKALELSGGDVAIKKELELLDRAEVAQKKKDKELYAKMFSG